MSPAKTAKKATPKKTAAKKPVQKGSAIDELKFVIKDRADYEWARDILALHSLDERVRQGSLRAILFSPVWDSVDFKHLAEWILEDRLPVRYQIQMHKVIWGPTTTGV